MSAISSGTTSDQLRVDYLSLLVTQLQNQNPLDPMDTYQMSSQLSQLAQLEQLESLNSNFAKVLAGAQISQAAALVGKQVSYTSDDGTTASGQVAAVVYENGEAGLVVDDQVLGFEDIVSVEN